MLNIPRNDCLGNHIAKIIYDFLNYISITFNYATFSHWKIRCERWKLEVRSRPLEQNVSKANFWIVERRLRLRVRPCSHSNRIPIMHVLRVGNRKLETFNAVTVKACAVTLHIQWLCSFAAYSTKRGITTTDPPFQLRNRRKTYYLISSRLFNSVTIHGKPIHNSMHI